MADSGDLPQQLVDLGLTGYEARAYLALIGRDRYTAAQLARESGLPRQRIYDVRIRRLTSRADAYGAFTNAPPSATRTSSPIFGGTPPQERRRGSPPACPCVCGSWTPPVW